MKRFLPFLFLPAILISGEGACAQPGDGDARGELLYNTHCLECHRAEIHWRAKGLVTNWTTLYAQVRRWQANAGGSWDPGDTGAIARYLNYHYYHFAPGDDIRQ